MKNRIKMREKMFQDKLEVQTHRHMLLLSWCVCECEASETFKRFAIIEVTAWLRHYKWDAMVERIDIA